VWLWYILIMITS